MGCYLGCSKPNIANLIAFDVKFLLINRRLLLLFMLFVMGFLWLLSLQCCMPYYDEYRPIAIRSQLNSYLRVSLYRLISLFIVFLIVSCCHIQVFNP